jgi:predicted AAA+ superfamily ATPase
MQYFDVKGVFKPSCKNAKGGFYFYKRGYTVDRVMPHLRNRYLQPLLERSQKYSPITGIFGHRQVGKTTLASILSKDYLTLDKKSFLRLAQEDPETFLKEHPGSPLVIDECQFAPPLFPALKEWVRVHPKPGQFLLTGSVRFSSRKAIRESLTGRLIVWELLPMDLSEAHSGRLPDALLKILSEKSVSVPLNDAPYFKTEEFNKYLVQGGLPGIFSVRDPAIRKQRFDTQIDTLLERDLRLVIETTISLRNLRVLLTLLANNQCEPFELSSISRKSSISVPTLKKLIAAFEAMYLIRLVPTEGTEKKPVIFFEDQGEASYLTENKYDDLTQLTRFLYANLRVQFHYRPELECKIFQFRNRGGAFLPLCFRSNEGELGIIPIHDENPGEASLATARSFLNTYSKAKVLFVHLGENDQVLSSRMRVLGVSKLL